jgi:hypothetical protein
MAATGEVLIAMAIARKHHYVPQMYLTGFANDKDQCFVVDASTRKPFASSTANIAAGRDYKKIEAQGVPADALEKELGKFEGVIAPGIKRVRETASFGENGKDREDIINLITLLAVRNARTRNDMNKLYTELFQAMVVMSFEDPALRLSDRNILFPLSSKVALVGRLQGDEDVIEVDRETVARFNSMVIGYAMKQIYAADDQFWVTR